MGYSKTHEKGYLLGPMVSSRGTVTYGIAQELTNIIRPLVEHSSPQIRNIQDFVEQVKSIRIEEGECIISYDMKDLFTSVTVDHAIKLKLEWDTQLHLRTSMSIQQIIMLYGVLP